MQKKCPGGMALFSTVSTVHVDGTRVHVHVLPGTVHAECSYL